MNRYRSLLGLALFAGVTTAAAPREARAQLTWTVYTMGEVDAHDLLMLLGNISLRRSGLGLSPVGGVSVYSLRYPVTATSTNTVTGIVPSLGIANTYAVGQWQARVGYVYLTDEDRVSGTVPVEGSRRSPNVSLQGVYWGNGNIMASGYTSYNFRAEFLGFDGRLLRRVAGVDPHPIYLGGAVGYQGGGDTEDKYNQFSIGPALQYGWSNNARSALIVGAKWDNGARGSGAYGFLKADLSFSF